MQASMKTLYLDIFSGISGDMFIGALIDLGVNFDALDRELAKLGLDGYHLHCARRQKAQIEGVKFDVHLTHAHRHGHEHEHQEEHEHKHAHAGGMVQSHSHSHRPSHEHGHEQHEPGHQHESDHEQDHEDHQHEHGH